MDLKTKDISQRFANSGDSRAEEAALKDRLRSHPRVLPPHLGDLWLAVGKERLYPLHRMSPHPDT